jgi:hypothetical protein
LSLTQTVTEATRVTKTSRSLIDLLLCSDLNVIEDTKVVPGVSDHLAVCANIKFTIPRAKYIHKSVWNYKKADWKLLRTLFVERISMLGQHSEVNLMWEAWCEVFWNCVQIAIPKVVMKGKRRAPWITSDLLKLIKKRDKLFEKCKKIQSDELWSFYKQFRNKVKTTIRKAQQKHVWKLGSNSKGLWKFIRSKSGSAAPAHFVANGCVLTDAKDIANAFNDMFKDNFTPVRNNANGDLDLGEKTVHKHLTQTQASQKT